jgi:hypothetical protein
MKMNRALLLLCALALFCWQPEATAVEGRKGAKSKRIFASADIIIDTGKETLAGYQLEVNYPRSKVTLVGVEGGSGEGYAPSPKFDSRGLTSGRIILAALAVKDKASPTGRIRVARLHLFAEPEALADLVGKVGAAIKPGGAKIRVKVIIVIQKEAAASGTEEREKTNNSAAKGKAANP